VTRVAHPVRPTIAIAQGATGTTIVEVKLSASGSVAAARVVETSGNKWLDPEALDAARSSTFAPAIHQCEPIAGSYRLAIDFPE